MTKRVCTRCDRATKELQGTRRRICDRCQKKVRKQTARRNHVARTYGLTPEDYEALLLFQDDRCAITGKKMPYVLNVDHDHATGRVRGLLSKAANKLLRDVRDNPDVLRRAIAYLDNPPARQLGIVATAPTEGGDDV